MPEAEIEDDPPFSLRRLEPTDAVRGLSLGHADFKPLKTFFEKHAKSYERNSLCRTYATVKNETGKIVGYVSIICGEVLIEKGQNLEHDGEIEFNYDHYPAIKIARLAVDKRYRGNDLGLGLVDFALGVAKEYICPHIGCRFAVVDAKKQSVKFYEKCGFTLIDTPENLARDEPVMFIDLSKVGATAEVQDAAQDQVDAGGNDWLGSSKPVCPPTCSSLRNSEVMQGVPPTT